jgi:hypothetical protein
MNTLSERRFIPFDRAERVLASIPSNAEPISSPELGNGRPFREGPTLLPFPQPLQPPWSDPPLGILPSLKRRRLRFLAFAVLPAALVSSIIHLLVLFALARYALTTTRPVIRDEPVEVVQAAEQPAERQVEALVVEIPMVAGDRFEAAREIVPFQDELTIEIAEQTLDASLIELLIPRATPASEPLTRSGCEKIGTGTFATADFPGFSPFLLGASPILSQPRSELDRGFSSPPIPGRELAARAQRRRQALAQGGTMDSEHAVDLALRWLVKHQRSDGSWSFQHGEGDHGCRDCACTAPGRPAAENGATGLVLLALLGAGHTHLEGDYREAVADGLRYLSARQTREGSLMDPGGNMYSHGLAALALCEALAMTDDPDDPPESAAVRAAQRKLADNAQRAIRFIERAQHSGGGWRYAPKQPGDTSVFGWQLMALRSGHLAGLTVDLRTVKQAVRFLDSVADDTTGSSYGYTHGRHLDHEPADPAPATTAIGLLGRMYTGWQRDHPGIQTGVDRLMHFAEGNQGLYFEYYATQVLHHYGGISWQLWNERLRNELVRQQHRRGSEAGSWLLNGPHDDAGRLYCTALAALCLEVYYRHLPLYGDEAIPAAQLPVSGGGR